MDRANPKPSPKLQVLQPTIVGGRLILTTQTGEQLTPCTPVRNCKPRTACHKLKPVAVLSKKVQRVKRDLIKHTQAVERSNAATARFIAANKTRDVVKPGEKPTHCSQAEVRAILRERLIEKQQRRAAEGPTGTTAAALKCFKPPSKAPRANNRALNAWTEIYLKLSARLANQPNYESRIAYARYCFFLIVEQLDDVKIAYEQVMLSENLL